MKYYVAEVQNIGSKREAAAIEAKDIAAAKRTASRQQVFEGTVLEIGTMVDGNGFLTDCIFFKVNGKWEKVNGKWEEV